MTNPPKNQLTSLRSPAMSILHWVVLDGIWPVCQLSWVRVILAANYVGYELSWVRVALGTTRPVYEFSWIRIVYNLKTWTFRTLDNSYTSHLVPRPPHTKDNSYPRRLMHRSTCIQHNSYPRQIVPRTKRTQGDPINHWTNLLYRRLIQFPFFGTESHFLWHLSHILI